MKKVYTWLINHAEVLSEPTINLSIDTNGAIISNEKYGPFQIKSTGTTTTITNTLDTPFYYEDGQVVDKNNPVLNTNIYINLPSNSEGDVTISATSEVETHTGTIFVSSIKDKQKLIMANSYINKETAEIVVSYDTVPITTPTTEPTTEPTTTESITTTTEKPTTTESITTTTEKPTTTESITTTTEKPTTIPVESESTTPPTEKLPVTGENHNNYGIYFLGAGLVFLAAAIGIFRKRKLEE